MDSNSFQNIKAEKAKAMQRYQRMQKLTIVFRLIEFCVFLVVCSRFSVHFPPAIRISGDYFRGLSLALISPRFVFVLGNIIVIILFVNSGRGKVDLYHEYVEKCETNRGFDDTNDEIKKQGKQGKQSISASEQSNSVSEQSNSVLDQEFAPILSKKRKINRSQSESWSVRRRWEEQSKDLRRSTTVGGRESEEKAAAETAEMSSEEFRRTVEDFIARQQRFLREEEEFSKSLSFM